MRSWLSASARAGGAASFEQALSAALEAGCYEVGAGGYARPDPKFVPPAPREGWTWDAARDQGLFFIKRLGDAHPRKTLGALLEALRRRPELRAAPLELVGDLVIAPFLPGALDLTCMGDSSPAVQQVHGWCFNSFEAFVRADSDLRAEARRNTPFPHFPVADRYAEALRRFFDILGVAADENAQSTVERLAAPDRQILFCDPKPANFLICRPSRPTIEAGDPHRIDLDLMYMDAPVSLQVLLIYFSFPLAVDASRSIARTSFSQAPRPPAAAAAV